jgi:tetratricopeptide (TPR) repeat protein
LIGQTVSRYRIVERLGGGGMGEVYLALDPVLKRSIAIKFPHASKQSPQQIRRFLNEARAASRLDHPNIARVYDFGETVDGRPFIVMEFVDGNGLDTLIGDGPMPPTRALALVVDVLGALEEAHRASMVHRDIKPANIRISSRGQVKVLDFGLAKQLGEGEPALPHGESTLTMPVEQTAVGIVMGSPQYMSPEQAQALPIDGRSDLFSVGSVLYESLTGQPAFRGPSTREAMNAVIRDEPPRPSSLVPALPARLDTVIAKALAKNPANRYQSAEEMRRDVRSLSATLSATGVLQRTAIAFQERMGTRRRIAASAGVVVLAVTAGWWLSGRVTEILAIKPSTAAERFYREGVAALRDGTYYRASRALERATSLDGRFRQAHARLAEAWNELDYREKAQNELLKALSSSRLTPPLSHLDQLSFEALRLTLSREFREAVGTYERIAQSLPTAERAAGFVDLGRAHERNDDTGKALACYLRATQIDPQYAAAFLRSAILLDRTQKTAEAQAAFAKAEEIYRALSNIEGVTEVYFQRGRLASSASRVKEAEAYLAEASRLAHANGGVYQEVGIRLQQSQVLFLRGQTATAEKQAHEAIDLAQRSGMASLASRGLSNLGNALFVRGDLASAERVFREGLDYARNQGTRRQEAVAHFSLASLHVQQGDLSTVFAELDAAQSFFELAGYRRELGQTLVVRARAQRHQGDYEGALATAQKQLELAEESADPGQRALAQETVASSLLVLERFPEALSAYRRTTDLSRPLDDRVGLGYALMNTGKVCAKLGLYSEAEQAIEEAGRLAGGIGGLEALSSSLALARAEIALSREHFAEAMEIANQVVNHPGQQRRTSLDARMLVSVALARSGKSSEALRLSGEVLESAKSLDDPYHYSRLRLAWSETHLASGRSSDARAAAAEELDHFEKAGQLDSALRCAAVVVLAGRSTPAADEARRRGRQILDQIRGRWPPDALRSYTERPDVRRYRRTIETK